MPTYAEMDNVRLAALKEELEREYGEIKARGLALNMARGKPAKAQLDLSMPLLETVTTMEDCVAADGTDCRNYGVGFGLPEAKEFMACMLDDEPDNVIVFGNASLNIMYDTVARCWMFGTLGSEPWGKLDTVKWICPAPGYDRHFGITADLGIENVPVPMTGEGPDMDVVEAMVASDASIKGMWCVPKYSNPTGETYSEKTVRRLATMKTAAPDFRIFWDNAYCVHDLYDETDDLANIFDYTRGTENEDRVVAFVSTSKITFPGSGVAFVGASPAVIAEVSAFLKMGLISADKMNQLRHVRFLPNLDAVRSHMKKHAEFMRPRFEAVERKLADGLGGTGCATWTHPRGGYFVSFDGPDGSAKRVAALCAQMGVKLTPAGATWPGEDPRDTNIRIAPSYPSVEELEAALDVLVLAVKLVAAELAAEERA